MTPSSSPAPIFYASPAASTPPPNVPTQDDPAIADAARKQLMVDRGLRGRGATLLAGGAQPDPSQRAGARLLGNFGQLG